MIGFIRAILGIGKANEGLISIRRHICKDCKYNDNKWIKRCKICGCIISLKTKLQYEKCPVEKWK